ncbi:hypothetical protein H696_01523 [Fonticula alba]|uniref:Uncharacterized protein n=1 Tax=Fonticula alba TaxID=691883 RepID=A0A058ZF57_FONAL|nr:hypothetical protein H696_01523 [Fonticula alba]KCV72117.1 hypothetical protein H696_01523 [Fonticula alba]|eukprot:XP_009493695.1 hypothetical protein H696_01523 [Fonticula alba]
MAIPTTPGRCIRLFKLHIPLSLAASFLVAGAWWQMHVVPKRQTWAAFDAQQRALAQQRLAQ